MAAPDVTDNATPVWLWGLLGCGGLLLLGTCLLPLGVGYWVYTRAPDLVADLGTAEAPKREAPTAPRQGPTAPPEGPKRPGRAGPPPASPPPPFLPRRTRGERRRLTITVRQAEGLDGFDAGLTCRFDIRAVDRGSLPCNAQIACGGRLLYGGPQAGYIDCRFSAPNGVVGEDTQTTGQDGDPAVRIDTGAGTVTIRDDEGGPLGRFRIEAQITAVE